jgi:hypothetical protein
VEIWVLLDIGAEEDFMWPSLAEKLGASLESGKFGFTVGVFGEEKLIRRCVRVVQLQLQGTQAGSRPAQEFHAQHDILIAPLELSFEHDIVMGGPWKYTTQGLSSGDTAVPDELLVRKLPGFYSECALLPWWWPKSSEHGSAGSESTHDRLGRGSVRSAMGAELHMPSSLTLLFASLPSAWCRAFFEAQCVVGEWSRMGGRTAAVTVPARHATALSRYG